MAFQSKSVKNIINQTNNQSINSLNKIVTIDQSTNQTINRTTTNQTIYASINQSINQTLYLPQKCS